MGLLSSFVLGFLGVLLFLVDGLFVSLLFGNLSFLSLLDFSDGFLCQCLLILSLGILQLVDGVESNTFNGSLLFSFIISSSFYFPGIGLLYFFVESSPGGGPS